MLFSILKICLHVLSESVLPYMFKNIANTYIAYIAAERTFHREFVCVLQQFDLFTHVISRRRDTIYCYIEEITSFTG